MKTDLKKKVERLYHSFWILFLLVFGLDFITTNLSIHILGKGGTDTFLHSFVPISNPLVYLAFFILVMVFAYGGTEYWRQKGIELYGRKSHAIITLIAAMVPLVFAIALLPEVIHNLRVLLTAIP